MTGNTDGNQSSSNPGNEEGYELWRLPEGTPSTNLTVRDPNIRSSPSFQQSTRSLSTSTVTQQGHRADLFNPQSLPLPSSSAGTSFLDPRSSLEALEAGLLSGADRTTNDGLLFNNAADPSTPEVESTDYASPSDTQPARIPLPSSGANSIRPSLNELLAHTTLHNRQSQTVAPRSLTYMRYVDQISQHLPHLTNMRAASRRDYARISVFDYSGSTLNSFRELHVDFDGREWFSKYDDLRSSVYAGLHASVDTRLLVVEDLGLSLIDLLGSTFNIAPEFFEEHLHRSGYHSGKENEHSPQTWSTSSMRKSYMSLKWYRPVTRWRQEPNSLEQRRMLLNTRDKKTSGLLTGSYDVVHTAGKREGSVSTVNYTIKTLSNIFRPEWAMSTEPDGIIPLTAPSGWEERATACAVTLEGHRYSSSS